MASASLQVSGKKKTADATPYAASLIQSLRDIGYSPETALADIIDNSITASARRIEIFSSASEAEPSVAILDDGCGMTSEDLVEAMRPGSRNPLDSRDASDLGRFGLGLKSASFSQCKRLTVLTKKNGNVSAATWDLDEVARTNRWEIELHDKISLIPWAEKLGDQGTLVLWRSLDRLSGGIDHDTRKRAQHINRVIAEAERHIRLVFHRFMAEDKPPLRILLNGRQLEPIDPFGTKFPTHQSDRPDRLELKDGVVEFKSFTLPHHKSVSNSDWQELGGPEGHLRSQGFYVYRGRRLIIPGSWLGMARQTELTKLCRIRVDIPNTMDADWKIDVKKVSAQLPPAVRERMRLLVERLAFASKRTYQRRGQRLVDSEYMPVWQRMQRDGAIMYRPDPAHPVFADFAAKLPEDLLEEFANLIGLVGSSVPVASLHSDFAGNPEDVRVEDADESSLRQLAEAMIPRLIEQGTGKDGISDILCQIDPFKSAGSIAKAIIDEITERETPDD